MKGKFFKGMTMFALAAMIGVSAFSTDASASSDKCGICNTYTMELNHGVSVSYLNSDEHLVSVTHVYTCSRCGDVDDQSYSYTEGHDYELIESSSGKMTCTGCYDTYYWK